MSKPLPHKISDAIEYFPETGALIWKVAPSKRIAAGSVAGSPHVKGYRRIQYHGHQYLAHRLAWFLMTGDWPAQQIDHRNCDRSDNRWDNLRAATQTQNSDNCRGRGKLPKGVHLHQCGKFQSLIRENGNRHYLGLFDTVEKAATAYAFAAKKYFGEFARLE